MRNKTSFVRYSPKFITRKWYCRKAKSQNETSKWKHNPTDKEIKSIFFTRFILFYFFLFIFLLLSFIKARKIEWKDGICIRVYSLLFEPFKAFSLPLSRPIPFIPPARSQRQRHRHICPVVGGGCDGGCCCIKDSVEMLFFHHQFYYFLQIYFSFRLLFSNFTCC